MFKNQDGTTTDVPSSTLFLAELWAMINKELSVEDAITHLRTAETIPWLCSFSVHIEDPRDITKCDWVSFISKVHGLDDEAFAENALELHVQHLAMLSELGEDGDPSDYLFTLVLYPDSMAADLCFEKVN